MRIVLGAVGSMGVALVALLACNAGSTSDACEEGSEDCACYPNDTCDSGLTCDTDDGVCVGDGGLPGDSSGGASNTSGGGSGDATTGGSAGNGGASSTDSPGSATTDTTGGESTSDTSSTTTDGGGESTSSDTTGGAAGSGGSANGSGGATTSTTGTPPDTTGGAGSTSSTGGLGSSTTGAPGDPNLIDDFADCDGSIPELDGRNGVWYMLGSATTQTETVGSPPDSLWDDQSCGYFVTGYCSGCDASGAAVIIDDGSHDLSGYTGVSVTYESEATVYVTLKTTDGSAYGYAQSAGLAPTGNTSGTRQVAFASLSPDLNYHGLEWVQEIHFTVDDNSKELGFGLGIHRVELY